VLEAVFSAGARAALPGEFSFKAFINGKIDLTQAEAIQELIGAKNDRALDAAGKQLEGALSKKILRFQKQLYDVAAILEAWVDFPEEGLEFATTEEIVQQLKDIVEEMRKLEATYHDGKIIHEGISLALIGSPNVGKSSLMNTLLQKERAIVSHIPGTTRDVLEDHLRLNGLNFRVLDTAGIRDADDVIEQEGIRRSRQTMEQADLIILVLDSTRGISDEERILIDTLPKKRSIVVWNKIDLSNESIPPLQHPAVIAISAKEETGIDGLKLLIDKVLWDHGPPAKDEVLITNLRHKEAVTRSIEYCENLIAGLTGDVSPEFLTLETRQALGELGKIVGADVTEDILSAIFSKFCIGK
jgi:tRNA modification GTPase